MSETLLRTPVPPVAYLGHRLKEKSRQCLVIITGTSAASSWAVRRRRSAARRNACRKCGLCRCKRWPETSGAPPGTPALARQPACARHGGGRRRAPESAFQWLRAAQGLELFTASQAICPPVLESMVVPIAQGVGQLSTGLLGILGDDKRGGQADIGDHAFFAAHTQVQLIAVQRHLPADRDAEVFCSTCCQLWSRLRLSGCCGLTR
jgi:hypothetical protein